MEERQYEIGGTTYIQRPLVLGQLRQLLKVMEGIYIPSSLDAMGLINAMSGNLPTALAIVLSPRGVAVRDKDITALTTEIEFAISLEQIVEVVEDFFDCNPLPSLLEKVIMAAGSITKQLTPAEKSTVSASSSPAETSAAGTGSSGDSHLTSAGPGSKAEGEMSSSGNP